MHVKAERAKVGGIYSVDPQIAWNGKSRGNVTFWTSNGMNLDRVVFLNNIQDGKTLFGDASSGSKTSHRFTSDMNIIEIAELFSTTMQTEGGWLKIETLNLKVENFGPFEGFIFDTKMVSEGGLVYKGMVSGAVIDGKLYLAFFLAPELRFYPEHIDLFRKILLSIQKT